MTEVEGLTQLESGSRADTTLLNLIKETPVLHSEIQKLPFDLIDLTERELERRCKPKREHRLLKISFWDEYRRAQRDEKNRFMVMENVYHGVCGRKYFYNHILRSPETLAWLITPPADEMLVQKELLRIGTKRLEEVLKLPFEETVYKTRPGRKGQAPQILEQKKVNVSLIKEVRAIVELLQNRVHGAVIQRAQNVNVNLTNQPPPVEPDVTLEDLEKMAKELARLEQRAQVIDADITPTQEEAGSHGGEETAS